ncbi:MAG TPA: hypothetical protein VIL28_17070, partial [Steroidobacteraceae bacterium]
IDTNLPDEGLGRTAFEPGDVYGVTARSLLLFTMVAANGREKENSRVKEKQTARSASPRTRAKRKAGS